MLRCRYCHQEVPPSAVDPIRQIATCPTCGYLVDVRPSAAPPTDSASAEEQAVPGTATPRPRLRAAVGLPAGISIQTDEESAMFTGDAATQLPPVKIRRRWLRGKHLLLLVVFWSAIGAVAYHVVNNGFGAGTGLACLFLAWVGYLLLGALLNTTTVWAGKGEVRVKHGPLPIWGVQSTTLKRDQIQQLYAVRQGAQYAVKADLHSGPPLSLVFPLATEEQALFVEQQIEGALGIADYEVPGELGSTLKERFAQASAANAKKRGAGPAVVLGMLMPLVIGGGVLTLFFTVFNAEVNGQLQYGTIRFVPTDCRSGEHQGFFGVDLSSAEGQLVRFIHDPVRGTILQFRENPGSPPQPLSLSGCQTADVAVSRTNTTINNIQALDGRLLLECSDLNASVTFANCH